MSASLLAATEAAGAEGAPLDQLAVLAAVYGGGTAGLMWLVRAHRAGRTRLLTRAGAAAAFVFRAPAWVALPVLVAAVSLLLTMFGGYWDIGYHIDYGRDDGPLGNPGHYPMLAGFFGTFAAGILACALAREKDAGPAWVRIRPRWRVPVGGLLIVGASTFGLAALPLDDVWHRIFGQDVTLWSPTHFMLLGGACTSVIGMCVLIAEGMQARRRRAPSAASANGDGNGAAPARPRVDLPWRGAPALRLEVFTGAPLWASAGRAWGRIQRFALLGGMLVGLEAFLAEFDWGVPLYRQVWQPILLAAFAALLFTAARSWAGRGGAIGAWVSYVLIRLAATAMPVLAGRSPSVVPILLAPAILIELAALRLDPRTRPIVFGAVAGLLCGSVGMAGEYAWSQLVMPLPWTEALIAEGLPSAILAGTAGGVLGALLAAGLRAELPPPRVARTACIGAFAVLVAVGVGAGIKHVPDASASFQLTETRPAPQREATATVRLSPPSAADDANWLYVLAWQGGEGTQRIVDRLQRIAPGVYRTTRPIPLHGSWKSGLRLQRGRDRGAVPIRLPADDALADSGATLPASFTNAEAGAEQLKRSAGAELRAPAAFSRPFLDDGLIVLRETKGEVADWVWGVAIGVIALFYVAFITGVSCGVARLTRRRDDDEQPRGPVSRRAAKQPAATA